MRRWEVKLEETTTWGHRGTTREVLNGKGRDDTTPSSNHQHHPIAIKNIRSSSSGANFCQSPAEEGRKVQTNAPGCCGLGTIPEGRECSRDRWGRRGGAVWQFACLGGVAGKEGAVQLGSTRQHSGLGGESKTMKESATKKRKRREERMERSHDTESLRFRSKGKPSMKPTVPKGQTNGNQRRRFPAQTQRCIDQKKAKVTSMDQIKPQGLLNGTSDALSTRRQKKVRQL